MAKLENDDKIIVNDQTFVVSDLLDQFVVIDGETTANFFKSINLTVPRIVRISTLKDILRGPVAQIKAERANLADELGYRLLWFERYTDTQLVNLLEFYNNKKSDITSAYLYEFWRNILGYLVDRGISEDDIKQLISLAEIAKRTKKKVNSAEFNERINPIFHDDLGKIDGLTPEEFRPVTYRASTLPELRSIGKKYGVNVPKRLRKQQLLDIMFKELEDREELTEELKATLLTKNIIILERYCKDNNIKASTELKKEEIIEYILANASETKAAYYVPTSQVVYEKVVRFDPVEEVMVEETIVEVAPPVIITDEVETEYIPVVEEIQEQQPTTIINHTHHNTVITDNKDYDSKLDQILAEIAHLEREVDYLSKRDVTNQNGTPNIEVNVNTGADGEQTTAQPKKKKKKAGLIILIIIESLILLFVILFLVAIIINVAPDTIVIQQIFDFFNLIPIGNQGLMTHLYNFVNWIRGLAHFSLIGF